MKKLISIGVALALLVMVVVPGAVAAQDEPGTYSKTPFGILGTGIILIGDVLAEAQGIIEALGVDLGFSLGDVVPITNLVGDWTGVNLAWMTDMTAWSMVVVGDVVKQVGIALPAMGIDLDMELGPLADMFYVVGARLWDPWGDYAGNATLPDVVIDEYPPTLPS